MSSSAFQENLTTCNEWFAALKQGKFLEAMHIAISTSAAPELIDLSRYAGRYVQVTYRNGEEELILITYRGGDKKKFYCSFDAQERARKRGDSVSQETLRRTCTTRLGNSYERDGRVNNNSYCLPYNSRSCYDIVSINVSMFY